MHSLRCVVCLRVRIHINPVEKTINLSEISCSACVECHLKVSKINRSNGAVDLTDAGACAARSANVPPPPLPIAGPSQQNIRREEKKAHRDDH